jgi:hypothetical protein
MDNSSQTNRNSSVGYIIVQEISGDHLVVGSKPFGKIWYSYDAILEHYNTIIKDWQFEFENNLVKESQKPKIVKILICEK